MSDPKKYRCHKCGAREVTFREDCGFEHHGEAYVCGNCHRMGFELGDMQNIHEVIEEFKKFEETL